MALAAVAAGCGGGSRELAIEVTPRSSLATEPVHITVTGAEPRSVVTVQLRSRDAAGTVWRSSARFRTDANGSVVVDRTSSSGDYGGVWGMGLVTTLRPTQGLARFTWAGPRPLSFELRARSENDVATMSFRRRLSTRRLTTTLLTVARSGFLGEYVAPADVNGRPAVVVLGGSEGGFGLHVRELARSVAAHGYPALALAYFAEEGLPQYLYRIPLEYFASALRWLERRPEVDPSRLLTFGVSRGSEAALLLGVHFPQLVHGAIAAVPSNVVHGPSWTLHGRDVPYSAAGVQSPTHPPRAVIPTERIRGPVFAFCATYDDVWPSCRYARRLVARLRRHGRPHVFHELRRASHYAVRAPYAISSFPGPRADEQAVARLWPRLLAFLEGAAR